MWVGIFGEGRLLARARPRSKSIALCNESDGLYLGEQEHVQPSRRMAVEVEEGRGRE